MKDIVVGYVDAETAQQAVREAAALAVITGATLHVVHAMQDPDVEVIHAGSDEWRMGDLERAEHDIREYLESLAERPTYTAVALEGRPGEVLVREAERLDADLIVVGNVRMQGPGRMLGSVGSDVAHHAPCNVMIVNTV